MIKGVVAVLMGRITIMLRVMMMMSVLLDVSVMPVTKSNDDGDDDKSRMIIRNFRQRL